MDPNKILQIANEDLYDGFIEQVLTTPTSFRPVIEELEKSERFSSDFIFRIHVQTAKQFVEVVSLNHSAVQDAAEELIERATTLELYELVNLNYHIYAISNKQLGHFEKALHGFFYIINSERLHGLHHLTSMAYFYIGEIYLNHDEMQLANKYLNLSLEVL
ncbi:MAG: hypothetical protein Q4A52_07015, partial [Bacillota bacterium]|nr:hypothetical protein [Bacillota bacterium]